MAAGQYTISQLKVKSGKTTSEFEDMFDDNKVPDYKIRKALSGGDGGFSTEEKIYVAGVLGFERSRIDWQD